MPSSDEHEDPFDESLEPIDLTPILLRRMSWDCLPCGTVVDIQKKLGLVPGSDDNAQMEHQESHRRMEQVGSLEPSVEVFATVLSKILGTAMLDATGVADEVSNWMLEKFLAQNAEVIRISAQAIIAQFIATGVLTYGEAAFK